MKRLLVPALLVLSLRLAASPIAPTDLRTEFLHNPINIATPVPRFSWTYLTNQRNFTQSTYHIQVSEQEVALREGKNLVWDSGLIESGEQNNISYAGPALRSHTRYYWRVSIQANNGEPPVFSSVHFFETAFLPDAGWSARWIDDGKRQPTKDDAYYLPDRMPLFRHSFQVSKKIISARLYIAGLGYNECYLNGSKINDHVLDPGWTAYGKQVLYTTHDITSFLRRGSNVAGIMLGNGWWNPLPARFFGRWELRDYQQTGRPCVKAEIHINYMDGTTQVIGTDSSWLTTEGPVVRNNVYLGEHYDARMEVKAWLKAGRVSTSWKQAAIADGPAGILTPQMQPPIRVTRRIRPVRITETGKDTFVVDMGQNFAGVVEISVKGKRGQRITLRSGEGLFPDGRINVMTTVMTQIKKGIISGGPGAPETAWQEDSYTLSGTGRERWSPRFTFHGFQFVEITGWPGRPSVDDITGLRMNADLRVNGEFTSSDSTLNRLHDVIKWTFLSNVFSVQSDCPGREKMGYGADMVVTANSYMYNYDMSHFYEKAITDFRNDQRPLGGMTEIAPSTGINDRGYADSTGPLGWQLAYPYLQDQLFNFYGDKKLIEKNYPALRRQVEFLRTQADNHLFHRDIGDHEALDPKSEAFSATCFYLHHVEIITKFAGLLGKKEDSLTYERLGRQIRKTIRDKFEVPNTGRFDNATQAAQIFALWYNLPTDSAAAMTVLLSELDRHKGHLSTGIFSTWMIFDLLRKNNLPDIAFRLATQPGYPGWRYMLDNGATTLWETWAFPELFPSRNHPMFGSIDEWFYRGLLGINSHAPGFRHILIQPQLPAELNEAGGYYHSVRGEIRSHWKKDHNKLTLRVTIPGNTTATVRVPRKSGPVLESGKNATPVRYERGYAIFETGSGDYTYTSTIK